MVEHVQRVGQVGESASCSAATAAVTALDLILAEGRRRAWLLVAAGATSCAELTAGKRFPPILNIVDEASGLLLPDRIPAGIPKDHPLAVEAAQADLLKAALSRSISKIIAELRFVGVRMLLASQVTDNSTGIGPSLKAKTATRSCRAPTRLRPREPGVQRRIGPPPWSRPTSAPTRTPPRATAANSRAAPRWSTRPITPPQVTTPTPCTGSGSPPPPAPRPPPSRSPGTLVL